MWGRSLFTAPLAASLLCSAVEAGSIFARNDYPPQPPCSYPFTLFKSVGCYADPPGSRALEFATGMDMLNMTIELCTASCKNNGFQYAGIEYYRQCFCGER